MAHSTYYSSIDLHKRTCFIITIDETGHLACQQKLKNHPDALRSYFRKHEGAHRAVVESTTGWYWLADLLRDEGVALTLAHAKHLKAISYAKVKTDKVDSETLAELLRAGLIPEAHMISDSLPRHAGSSDRCATACPDASGCSARDSASSTAASARSTPFTVCSRKRGKAGSDTRHKAVVMHARSTETRPSPPAEAVMLFVRLSDGGYAFERSKLGGT